MKSSRHDTDKGAYRGLKAELVPQLCNTLEYLLHQLHSHMILATDAHSSSYAMVHLVEPQTFRSKEVDIASFRYGIAIE